MGIALARSTSAPGSQWIEPVSFARINLYFEDISFDP